MPDEEISRDRALILAQEAGFGAVSFVSVETLPSGIYLPSGKPDDWWWFSSAISLASNRVGGDTYIIVHKKIGRVMIQIVGE
ncbi:MAG: hypothetical protein HQM09_17475 [Candidatus Riflebacteria bacterium]|nr:hypothetical protein [Candidatus Riflebacteria bacterium]